MESYKQAFEGLKGLLQPFDLIQVHSPVFNDENYAFTLFCGITFSEKRLLKFSSLNIWTENEIKDLVKGRRGTSIKELEALISKNPMYLILLKFTFETLRNYSEFPISFYLLENLLNLEADKS